MAERPRSTIHQVSVFFGATVLVSWLLWAPVLLDDRNLIGLPDAVGVLGMLPPLVPAAVASGIVFHSRGGRGVRELWSRVLRFGGSRRWVGIALVVLPTVGIVVAGVLQATDSSAGWDPPALVAMVPTFLVILVVGGGLEEIGWRGFALDVLLGRVSPAAAAVVVGAVWGVWHLPLHWISTTTQFHIPVWEYVLSTVVLSFLFTGIYLRTGPALGPVVVMHTAGNTAAAFLPPFFASPAGRWIYLAVLTLAAAVVARLTGVWPGGGASSLRRAQMMR